MRRRQELGWIIWSLAVAFYFYEFVLRISPSVMIGPLSLAFHVDSAALGAMSAFYLFAYAPMQIPVGLLMDRFGARRLLTFATAVCGLGGLVFGMATILGVADLGRLLMGLGSSFAYVGIVYVASTFFPKEKLPFLIGLAMSIGMVGAIAGSYPVAFSVEHLGWRTTAIGYGIVGLVLSVIIYWVIRLAGESAPPLKAAAHERPRIWKNLGRVCSNGQTWINAIISLLMYATTAVFAALWGPTFLESVYGMSKEAAGGFTSGIFVGWIIGGPFVSYLAMKTGHRRLFIMLGALFGFITISLIVFVPDLPHVMLFLLLVMTGFFSTPQALSFSLAVELNDREAKGTAAALTNFLVMLFASGLQPLVGFLLDMTSGTTAETAMAVYTADNFKVALSIFPACFLLALFLTFFLRPPKALEEVEGPIVPLAED